MINYWVYTCFHTSGALTPKQEVAGSFNTLRTKSNIWETIRNVLPLFQASFVQLFFSLKDFKSFRIQFPLSLFYWKIDKTFQVTTWLETASVQCIDKSTTGFEICRRLQWTKSNIFNKSYLLNLEGGPSSKQAKNTFNLQEILPFSYFSYKRKMWMKITANVWFSVRKIVWTLYSVQSLHTR